MEFNVIDMNELGKQVGAPSEMHMFGDREMEAVRWELQYELKALEKLKEMAANHKPFRFIGHPSKWLLTAMCLALAENRVFMYIPGLDVEVEMKALQIGTEDDGFTQTEVTETDDIVTVKFTWQDVPPDAMEKMVIPAIPEGKDVVIIATGHPILPSVCMAMSYAGISKSVWLTPQLDDTYCVCGVTNDNRYSLGSELSLDLQK